MTTNTFPSFNEWFARLADHDTLPSSNPILEFSGHTTLPQGCSAEWFAFKDAWEARFEPVPLNRVCETGWWNIQLDIGNMQGIGSNLRILTDILDRSRPEVRVRGVVTCYVEVIGESRTVIQGFCGHLARCQIYHQFDDNLRQYWVLWVPGGPEWIRLHCKAGSMRFARVAMMVEQGVHNVDNNAVLLEWVWANTKPSNPDLLAVWQAAQLLFHPKRQRRLGIGTFRLLIQEQQNDV